MVQDNERVITGLKRISKPGLRVYAKTDEVPKVLNGLGIALVSTSKGVITDKEARAKQVGGEIVATFGNMHINEWRCNKMSRVGKKPIEVPAGVTSYDR